MRHGLCVYCDNSSQIGQTVTQIDVVFFPFLLKPLLIHESWKAHWILSFIHNHFTAYSRSWSKKSVLFFCEWTREIFLLLVLFVIFTFGCDSQCSTTWILWMSAGCFERDWAAAPCTDIWQHGFVQAAAPLCFCIGSAGHGEKHRAVPVPSASSVYLCAELAEPAYLLHWISSSKRDWN